MCEGTAASRMDRGREAAAFMNPDFSPITMVLYRFFCGFPWFDDTFRLELEAVGGGTVMERGGGESCIYAGNSSGGNNAIGAIFSMNPTISKEKQYINGRSVVRGSCSVTLLCRDHDPDARIRALTFFGALGAYTADMGTFDLDMTQEKTGEGVELEPHTECAAGFDAKNVDVVKPFFRVRAASVPVRMYVIPGGAVWEMTFSFEIFGFYSQKVNI